jgi:hypothetical protein
VTATVLHSNVEPKAVAAVDFLRHRSAAAHHLALVGIYNSWNPYMVSDTNPESLVSLPPRVASELRPHYWRALGRWAYRYWYDSDRSLSQLTAHLQVFVPRLDPSVQRYFLQGVGQALFAYTNTGKRVSRAELERFPKAYQESLLEGWGMVLGEVALYDFLPLKGHDSLLGTAWTKGFSARSLSYVQQGKAQFDALFEGAASNALKQPRHAQ